jgi:hypothetical protein
MIDLKFETWEEFDLWLEAQRKHPELIKCLRMLAARHNEQYMRTLQGGKRRGVCDVG